MTHKSSLVLVLFALAAASAQAQNTEITSARFPEHQAESAFASAAFPAGPMVSSKWTVNVLPGYFSYTGKGQNGISSSLEVENGSGAGGAVSLGYAFNPHVGVDFVAGGLSGTGWHAVENCCAPPVSLNGDRSDTKFSGGFGAAAVVIDPTPTTWWVHIKGLGGINFQSMKTTDDVTQPTYSISRERKVDGLGPTYGGMVEFDIGKVARVSWFYMKVKSFKDGTETCSATGIGACGGGPSQNVAIGADAKGLLLSYVPWNLDFLYNPPLDSSGIKLSLYSLKWSHSFGGS